MRLIGCGAKGDLPTAPVTGTVDAADGTVIESGKIEFPPVANGESLSGEPAVGRIKNGKLVLTTCGDNDGAVVRQHEVFLGDARAGERAFKIAPESQLVQVAEGDNVFGLKAFATKRKRDDEGDD